MAKIEINNLAYSSLDSDRLRIFLNDREIYCIRGGIQRPGHLMTPGGQQTDLSLSLSRPFG